MRLACLALLLVACGPEYPDPYPQDLRVHSGLDGALVQQALDTWNESFPGCPHVVASVEDFPRASYRAGDLGFGPVLPERPQTTARYYHPGRWLEITELAVERGSVVNSLLHELGHGHNVIGHTDTGIMRAEDDPADVTIDDAMVFEVCWADTRCCDR